MKTFSKYILPEKNISPQASVVTGLTVQEGTLLYKNNPVPAVTAGVALTLFMDFLRPLNSPVLVGHNIKTFDVPVLFHNLSRFNMVSEFSTLTTGFLDSRLVAMKHIPKKDLPPSEGYSQQSLVKTFMTGAKYNAHNAVDDVAALEALYNSKFHLQPADLKSFLFSVNYLPALKSLEPLVKEKAMSKGIQRKLATVGLGLPQLKKLYKRDPVQGIGTVFREPTGVTNKPKITNAKQIINKVTTFVQQLGK